MRKIINANDEKLCMEKALSLLSVRPYGEKEFIRKLKQKGFSESVIDKIVKECIRLELLDDMAFAEVYTAELIRRGYGKLHVKQALMRKSLPEEIISKVLDNFSENHNESQLAIEALRKKLGSLKNIDDKRKRREKAIRYLLNKGFSYEFIKKTLENEDFHSLFY